MKEFDVIIIGGGPAGIAAAKKLSESNLKFCIIEKEKFPRMKLCGGGLTSKSQDVLEELNLNYQIEQIIEIVKIEYKKKIYDWKMDRPIIMVDRKTFDNDNLNQIKELGIPVYEEEIVERIENNKIITNNHEFNFKYLIFADGINGFSKKYTKVNNTGYCIETDVKNITRDNALFSFNATLDGYGWIFPKKDKITIGLGKFKNTKADYKKMLHDFSKRNDIDLANIKLLGFPIPNGNLVKNPVIDNNKILVGDAAGLADPVTGEGIYYALLSGKLSAEAIIRANKTGESLEKIYQEKTKHIYKSLKKKKLVSKIFYTKLREALISIGVSNKILRKIAFKIVF